MTLGYIFTLLQYISLAGIIIWNHTRKLKTLRRGLVWQLRVCVALGFSCVYYFWMSLQLCRSSGKGLKQQSAYIGSLSWLLYAASSARRPWEELIDLCNPSHLSLINDSLHSQVRDVDGSLWFHLLTAFDISMWYMLGSLNCVCFCLRCHWWFANELWNQSSS